MNRLLVAALGSVIAIAPARAVAVPRLSTQLNANRVEVGQDFTLQLSCMVGAGDGSPADPRLTLPRGVTGRGPSISTQQNVSIINGQIQQQSGVVASWVLTASSVGHFRLGPATITVDGRKLSDRVVEIDVVERGTAPQGNRARRRGHAFDPFDPFGGSDPFSGPMFPPGMQLLPSPNQQLDEIPSYPPDLNVEKPRDSVAFLDARLTSTRVVVGEQVTLRIYAYGKPGPFELMMSSEPSRNDFLSFQNERDNPIGPLYRIKIDSEVWFARKILSYALFPTKSGRLTIGEAEANFAGAGLLGGNSYRNVQRKSQLLEVIVEEPPAAGRPAGYHIGDVGNFKLTANVEPRKVKATESVSVQVEVTGVGQLPQRLDPPEQHGVDWLEPTVTQQIDEQRDKIAGRRNFTYVVRLDQAGTVDLGTLRLPYFDPTNRKYAVASAALGTVIVEPPVAQASSGSSVATANGDDPFLAALQPRMQLGQADGTRTRYWGDAHYFFLWLFAGPLLSLALFGLRSGVRRLNDWRGRLTGSAKVLVEAELKAAQRAMASENPTMAAAAVERLLHLLIEHTVGLRSRGILRAELAGQIEQRGLDRNMGDRLVALLERCDHLRFVEPNIEQARSVVTEAEAIVTSMLPRLQKASGRAT